MNLHTDFSRAEILCCHIRDGEIDRISHICKVGCRVQLSGPAGGEVGLLMQPAF